MDIRLIGLDLDGTVFDSQKRISPRTRSAIAAACARGVAVLPATGRPRAGLPDAFVQIPGVRYAITSNGGAVYDLAGGRCMAVDPLPKEDALWALVRGRELGGLIDVYVEGRAYTGAATFEALAAAAEHCCCSGSPALWPLCRCAGPQSSSSGCRGPVLRQGSRTAPPARRR